MTQTMCLIKTLEEQIKWMKESIDAMRSDKELEEAQKKKRRLNILNKTVDDSFL